MRGTEPNRVESPERIAVVPAGSVAADADAAEKAPVSASTARITIERFECHAEISRQPGWGPVNTG